MKLGVNQLALLRRCYLKGNIGIKDVSIYYNLRANLRNKQRLCVILEKLEIQGFLIQINQHNWKLTEQGKHVVIDYLNLKKEAI